MLLTETKIQTEAYYHNQLGYDVTCSAARPSSARGDQGVVGMVTRKRPNSWDIESMRFHRPNVVSSEIMNRHPRTLLVGKYLPRSTLEHLPDVK